MSKAWPKSDGAEGEMGLILKQLDLIGSPYSQVSPHYLEPALKLMQNVIMLAIFEAAFEDMPTTVICGRSALSPRNRGLPLRNDVRKLRETRLIWGSIELSEALS